MKKAIYTVLVGLALFCACACGKGAEPQTERIVNVAAFSSSTEQGMGDRGIKKELRDGHVVYKYRVTAYGSAELKELIEAVRSDNAPDLLLFGGDIFPTGAYFDDLYAYLDGDDSLKRESFIPHFLNALEVDGGLYELWTDTELMTLAISDSGEAAANAVPENALSFIADAGLSQFIDLGSMICSFDNDAFRDMLKLCNSMENRELAWLSVDSMDAYAGYRFADDLGCCFKKANMQYSMAIPANSREKTGAWLYIKDALALDSQKSRPMPVINDAYEWKKASLDDEQAVALDALLESAAYRGTSADMELRNIVIEVGSRYLSGELSAEDAAALIQSDVSEYLLNRIL